MRNRDRLLGAALLRLPGARATDQRRHRLVHGGRHLGVLGGTGGLGAGRGADRPRHRPARTAAGHDGRVGPRGPGSRGDRHGREPAGLRRRVGARRGRDGRGALPAGVRRDHRLVRRTPPRGTGHPDARRGPGQHGLRAADGGRRRAAGLAGDLPVGGSHPRRRHSAGPLAPAATPLARARASRRARRRQRPCRRGPAQRAVLAAHGRFDRGVAGHVHGPAGPGPAHARARPRRPGRSLGARPRGRRPGRRTPRLHRPGAPGLADRAHRRRVSSW